MTDMQREKAMADKEAILELQRTEGWKVYFDAARSERERLIDEAERTDDNCKVLSLVRQARGIRNALEQPRWIIERGIKAEKEASNA